MTWTRIIQSGDWTLDVEELGGIQLSGPNSSLKINKGSIELFGPVHEARLDIEENGAVELFVDNASQGTAINESLGNLLSEIESSDDLDEEQREIIEFLKHYSQNYGWSVPTLLQLIITFGM